MEVNQWKQAVVYQVYPRSFLDTTGSGTGDLNGVRKKLGYLSDLGVNALWLSPVYASPMDDNGYDISDYQAIAPEFGTMEDMEALIAEARGRGIGIIMDLVVNHTSDEHAWFQESKKSLKNPFRNYYIWRSPGPDGGPPNALRSIFGGSAWEMDATTGQYYLHLFSRRQPDLNWQNPRVREQIHTMMNWWLEKGISGFRMDVIDLIGKLPDEEITANGPELHRFLQEMHEASFGKYDVMTVGETWGVTPETARLYSDPRRKELSMVFQFEHICLTWDPEEGKWRPRELDFQALKKSFARWQKALHGHGWNSLFWNNHDLPRAVSKYGDEGHLRVVSAKMLATALHGMQGTPYIYQGEEIGMINARFDDLADYRDIETLNFYREKRAKGQSHAELMEVIKEHGRDNARTPMQWSAETNSGFTTGEPWIPLNRNYEEINVASALEDKDSIYYHYKELISLRRHFPVIIHGQFELLEPDHPEVFAYRRWDDDVSLLVLCNFFGKTTAFSIPEGLFLTEECCLLSNYKDLANTVQGKLSLRPYEAIIMKL